MIERANWSACHRAPTSDDGLRVAEEPAYGRVDLPVGVGWGTSPHEADPFAFLSPEYALADLPEAGAPCAHTRVTGKTHLFERLAPSPVEAHQCLNCGEPVTVDEVARRRRVRAYA